MFELMSGSGGKNALMVVRTLTCGRGEAVLV